LLLIHFKDKPFESIRGTFATITAAEALDEGIILQNGGNLNNYILNHLGFLDCLGSFNSRTCPMPLIGPLQIVDKPKASAPKVNGEMTLENKKNYN
jgi:hypothetical protein